MARKQKEYSPVLVIITNDGMQVGVTSHALNMVKMKAEIIASMPGADQAKGLKEVVEELEKLIKACDQARQQASQVEL